ncbi:MAG: pyridoxal phosphate-dependent aminotransferase [Lachnospiraceae bacterium]|nr:pyridoxal phosphate-dependent aminotransferase [Lachnospiraceae bacterium]MBQ9594012.1 pyridoxal phosphate-dependent aminotransferase [Lachnospiraceae bacterium]
MGKRNLDEIIERRGTGSIKYDLAERMHMPEDVLPLWVADMDFRAPECVTEALKAAAEHGIFGYSEPMPGYYDAMCAWYLRNFRWKIDPSWVIQTPGVVYALSNAVRAFTAPGDPVLIQRPVYYPFTDVIEKNGRRVVNNPLKLVNGMYFMDLEDLEEKIIRENVRLMILCSPHNPVGRVWTKQEMLKFGEIVRRHGLIVVSDEIHSDFVHPGYRHHVFSATCPEMADYSVICTAPSKTFNLAGLQVSNIVVENDQLRDMLKTEIGRSGYGQCNQLGLLACKAAYEGGQEWLDEVRAYIKGNLDYVRKFTEERLPMIRVIEPEGTYLLWMDFSGLRLNAEELNQLIIGKARLWLDDGEMFGEEGRNFQRWNLACPRSVLVEAMERLEAAVREKFLS